MVSGDSLGIGQAPVLGLPNAAGDVLVAWGGTYGSTESGLVTHFIPEEEMPRTATGKILHRVLRERYGKWSDGA
ncbi:MAG: hypothetical protein QHH27_09200 [Clostridia bacterium]|jgi:hypothetical protein|nr:hypothetical protein [Clostridia bacterium]MDH7573708.1 hypothetical protein [Clostridia bacterium]